MRFSTRIQYGLRFLLRLSMLPKNSLIQLKQIAKEENISSGYLEQIVHALKPTGILNSTRGNGGGYSLAKAPEEINMEEVFSCLEGDLKSVPCLASGQCEHEEYCVLQPFWNDFDEHIRKFLRAQTLAQIRDSCPQPLMERYRRRREICAAQ